MSAMDDNDRRIDRVTGTAIPLRGNNIDTDRIIPARFLKAITFDGLGAHAFEDDRRSMPDHPFANPAYACASILIVNENFGSGSSREHAPQALKRRGLGACVGQSFSEIFLGNATTIGLPCATASAGDIELLMAAAERDPAAVMVLSVDELSILRRPAARYARQHSPRHPRIAADRPVGRHRSAPRRLRRRPPRRRRPAVRRRLLRLVLISRPVESTPRFASVTRHQHSPSFPAFFVSADWGKDARKRSVHVADLSGRTYLARRVR